ncbi:unnamed protein product [Ilex paraguariensis]|uniref:Formin-like protein n=1 Tax=Ilex paraguariensis TaxID=185542 RepID=A0ABC8RNT1_9AQUA
MALFRKFFYRKPPDGLLEISERVFVFDCCFTTDVLEDDDYKVYMGGIVRQLREYFPDASFMVFNFREGENQSQIANILSEYDMTVMDYPRQYENCPLLPMEMIHHFMRSSESWLSLGQRNVLLMHCERGGWPVLAYMLAALLIYRKQYTGEQKTLDMIYKQAPRELLQLMSPLNPLPSQLRYLQYVSRRNVGSEWPPLDRALTLDCIILRAIPSIDGEGGCRPIFRIYGQDPFMVADRTPKVLFSMPKRSKTVRHYKQADCELVKIDVHCHIQGDVVLECITLDNDLEREEMMFRVMFNTAFIRSNILMLNRDEIDILWNSKDQFPKDFRTEVLFSEMDSTSSLVTIDLPGIEDKEGLPVEAFAKVQEIFSNVDWLDPKSDIALNMLQQITASNILQEKLDSPQSAKKYILESGSPESAKKEKMECGSAQNAGLEKLESDSSQCVQNQKLLSCSSENTSKEELEDGSPQSAGKEKSESCSLLSVKNENSEICLPESARKENSEIGAPQSARKENFESGSPQNIRKEKLEGGTHQTAVDGLEFRGTSSEKVAETPKSKSAENDITISRPIDPREQSMPSLKPTGDSNVMTKKIESQELLVAPQRHAHSKIIAKRIPQTSLSIPASNCSSLHGSPVPISRYHSAPSILGITALLHDHAESKNKESIHLVTGSPHSAVSSPLPRVHRPVQPSVVSIPSPPQPLPSKQLSLEAATVTKTSYATPPPPPPPVPLPQPSPMEPPPKPSSHHLSVLEPSHSLLKHNAAASLKGEGQSSLVPPRPPPPALSFPGASPFPFVKNSFSTPPPPAPPPLFLGAAPSPTTSNSCSTPPPPPPPPPGTASSNTCPITSVLPMKNSVVPGHPQPPRPLLSGPASGSTVRPLAPPPPPPPSFTPKDPVSKNSMHIPPVPPPPAPLANGLSKAAGGSSQPHSTGSNGNIPPIPGPLFSAKGRLQPRTSLRNQAQPKKASLKPYHWLKLTRAMQGSLWAEAQKSDEASKAPDFDMSELESLFSATVPNSDHGTGGKSNRLASGPKSDKVHLVDLRRAYNCEIMLSKVKIPLSDLMSSVLALDDSALDIDQVDNLIKFCPTNEEMELLKNYNGDKENLGKCEKFFVELMKVPRVESKLRVFSFKMQFGSQVSDLKNSLNLVNSASEEVRNSVKLKRIMQTILSLGNALNHGTARGSAVGFRLDSLLKLTDTRARNRKLTLMHYLCKVLAEKLPELLDFQKDLASLEASTKIQLKYLAEEMQAISKGLERVVQELSASENDGPVSEKFCKTLKEFLRFAEAEVRSLAALYSGVGRNADALAFYFGEDPARCPFEQGPLFLVFVFQIFLHTSDSLDHTEGSAVLCSGGLVIKLHMKLYKLDLENKS